MKKPLAILALVVASITHLAPAQAQGTGGYYYADAYPSFCNVWFETHVCSKAESFATYAQAFFLSRIAVGAQFSGPGYNAWDSRESHIVMMNPFSFQAGVIVSQGPIYVVCAHSGWHDVRSIHTADLYGTPPIPLWDHEQFSAAYRQYCDCGNVD
jgi:hypothetical protein